jgi:hypothetical protein
VTIDFLLHDIQCRTQNDNWGGAHIHHWYSCSALLIYFEISCFYGMWTRIYEYVPPPNYRSAWLYGTGDISGFMRPLRTKIPLFDSAKTIVLTDVKCIN